MSVRTPNIFVVKWTVLLRSGPISDAENTLELSSCFIACCSSVVNLFCYSISKNLAVVLRRTHSFLLKLMLC